MKTTLYVAGMIILALSAALQLYVVIGMDLSPQDKIIPVTKAYLVGQIGVLLVVGGVLLEPLPSRQQKTTVLLKSILAVASVCSIAALVCFYKVLF